MKIHKFINKTIRMHFEQINKITKRNINISETEIAIHKICGFLMDCGFLKEYNLGNPQKIDDTRIFEISLYYSLNKNDKIYMLNFSAIE